MSFNLVYPVTSNTIDIGRFWNKGPGFSLVKSSNLLIHCMTPMLLFDSLSVGRGFCAWRRMVGSFGVGMMTSGRWINS